MKLGQGDDEVRAGRVSSCSSTSSSGQIIDFRNKYFIWANETYSKINVFKSIEKIVFVRFFTWTTYFWYLNINIRNPVVNYT